MPDIGSDEKYRAAARKIGSRADYVERLLTGLAVHERIVQHEYWGVDQPGASDTNFSVLTTALSYEGIAEWVGLDGGWDPELKGLDEGKLEKLDIREAGESDETWRVAESEAPRSSRIPPEGSRGV
jgi:hypothetical protein